MVQDNNLIKAVSSILLRAERQQDKSKITETFVDIGILPQLENNNNQIVYGRRGTGKTHVLKVLDINLKRNKKKIVSYIDARILGSAHQFSDPNVPTNNRCMSLFKDILHEITNKILNFLLEVEPKNYEKAFDAIDELSISVTEAKKKYHETSAEATKSLKTNNNRSFGFSLQKDGLATNYENSSNKENEASLKKQYDVEENDNIIFSELKTRMNDVLETIDCNLIILFDEWSSIPIEIQPYLAEFFKRSFLANPKITIKIASLEYRSQFSKQSGYDYIGLEVGCDISTAIDIDEYCVYDRNPERIIEKFSDILYLHLKNEFEEDYLKDTYSIECGKDMIAKLFTNKNVFSELVRASEGVARDLINIFSKSFYSAQRKGKTSIDKSSIIEAAQQWFEKDKAHNLDSNLLGTLRKIIDIVIGQRKARSFLVPRELEKHDSIQKLFDARVLHLIQKGYADKIHPGLRYNIYTLDYGTYVDLLHTTLAPKSDFTDIDLFNENYLLEDENGSLFEAEDKLIVPFDDKRSIRRIILTKNILEEPLASS